MHISKEMSQFKLKLEAAYDESRAQIPKDAADEFLVENEAYKRCFVIYTILATMFGTQEGYDWGEELASIEGYDTEKFISHYAAEVVKGPSGYKIDIKFNDQNFDTPEESQ